MQEARIFSPLTGIVLTRNFEAGETVFPGRVIYSLANLHTVYMKIYIPEKSLGRVSLGQQAIVHVDSFPGKDFFGSVTHISSKAEFTPKNVQTEDSRTRLVFAIKISVPNKKMLLKPGMPADGFLLEKKKKTKGKS